MEIDPERPGFMEALRGDAELADVLLARGGSLTLLFLACFAFFVLVGA